MAVPECFAEIFDRHAEGIYRYTARRLGQQAAADVMSEVFLAAFRNRRRYDTGRNDARPWLYGITINVISQYQRTQRRYARVLAAVPGVPATDVGEAGGDRLVATGAFDVALADVTRAWRDAIPNALGADVGAR